MKKVAIQGYSGCFHEQAARLFWCGDGARTGVVPLEEDIQTVECDTFDGLYAALDSGKADSAVMAINQTRPFFAAYPHIRLVESEDTAKMVCRAECRVFAAPSISGPYNGRHRG